ncbi:hypothetical protein GQ457_08G027590 [Hibiscus cannabinus]
MKRSKKKDFVLYVKVRFDSVKRVHSEKFSTVIHHGGFIVRRPRFKFTGKLVDYFDNLDVDTMSMFEIVDMVEKLGITYSVKVFWQLADKPIEVKQLKTDADVKEMVSNLPRDLYVHLYLEEVVGFSETKIDEPGLGEVEMDEPGLGEPEMDEPELGRKYQQEGRIKVKVKDLKPKRIKDYLECKISQRSPALLKYLLFNDS